MAEILPKSDSSSGLPDAISPLVSIIVPVYNSEKYLAECLDSLLNQSLKEIEIICVDDGSPDCCPAMLDAYAASDPRIKVIHQANGGVGAARNAGLKVASAPYVSFVDADDWVEPKTYQTALKLANSATDVDLVGWRYALFNSETNKKIRGGTGRSQVEGKPFSIKEKDLNQINLFLCNKLFKSQIIQKNNLTFGQGISEDTLFMLEYLPYSRRAICTSQIFHHYRRHAQSVMARLDASEASTTFNWSGLPVQKGFTSLILLENIFTCYTKRGILAIYHAKLWECLTPNLANDYAQVADKDLFWVRFEKFISVYKEDTESYANMLADFFKIFYGNTRNLADVRLRVEFFLSPKCMPRCFQWLNDPRELKRLHRRHPRRSWTEWLFSIKNIGPKKVVTLMGLECIFERHKYQKESRIRQR